MEGARSRTGMAMRWLGARGALLTLAAVAMLAAGASSASAVIVHLHGKTLSYQPLRHAVVPLAGLDELFSNLDYNGGPVMASNTNYTFYWDPASAPAYPAGYQAGVNRYLEDLAHDSGGHENVDSVSAQYNDAAGEYANYNSHFGGAILDTDPYPANGCTRAAICLTDAQLRAELTSYLTAHGYPRDLANEYFMLTPPGVEDCFEKAGRECSVGASHAVYCAYHSNIVLGAEEIVYANDPYVSGNPGCDDGNHPNGVSDGVLEGGLSHEHNESITDPEPNNAWTDFGGSGGENGDKCRVFEEGKEFGTPLGTIAGAKYNQVINGHFYWYQQEWSNQTNQCLQRLSFAGTRPTATFTRVPVAGDEVSFDASGSSAEGGVFRYNWQFNDGSPPTETTAPTVAHTFPGGGSFVVALTVFAGNGTSTGTAQTVTLASSPIVSALAPKAGPATGGTTVTISGSGFTGATAVSFGASAAAGFTVQADNSITAVSPAASKGKVNVTVTTPAGTSAISKHDRFKFKK